MTTVEELQNTVKQLQELLKQTQSNVCARQKIANMSAEVVDSNPYRYVILIFFLIIPEFILAAV